MLSKLNLLYLEQTIKSASNQLRSNRFELKNNYFHFACVDLKINFLFIDIIKIIYFNIKKEIKNVK